MAGQRPVHTVDVKLRVDVWPGDGQFRAELWAEGAPGSQFRLWDGRTCSTAPAAVDECLAAWADATFHAGQVIAADTQDWIDGAKKSRGRKKRDR